MKIAIHHSPGSFSERWISYCKKNNIDYKLVNAYDNDIIQQVDDCEAFMWHHNHMRYKDNITAKRILFALEHAGIKIFPNFNTGWHFDDKVAQKYLLEAIDAPLVPSYVFYDKQQALEWANKTTYPKVFKLKGGSGSSNVKLIKNENQAIKMIKKSFGRGISNYRKIGSLKERYRKYKTGKGNFKSILKVIIRLILPTEFSRNYGKEKGYAYFQEFIPNNEFDIRVIIIGDRAFAVKRMVRKNDFRASGSGDKKYNIEEIDLRCIEISFNVSEKIKSQSIAFDFVFNEQKKPLVVEISYGFAVEFYDPCPGYWDSNLTWHEGKFNPQGWMVENVINNA